MTLKMVRIPYSLTDKNLLQSCGSFTDLWDENHNNATHIGYSHNVRFKARSHKLKNDYRLRHIRLSVRTEQLASHYTDFYEII